MSEDVEITGLVETQRMLIDMPGELNRAGLRKALRAASEPIRAELHFNAPRRERSTGGTYEFPPLEESIETDIEVTRAGGVASTGFGESGPVALWIEEGHEIVTHAKKDTGARTEPNPFMARSTENIAAAAIDAFCDSILGTLRSQYGG